MVFFTSPSSSLIPGRGGYGELNTKYYKHEKDNKNQNNCCCCNNATFAVILRNYSETTRYKDIILEKKTNEWAFGNILLGGLIGWGVDLGTNAVSKPAQTRFYINANDVQGSPAQQNTTTTTKNNNN